MFYQVSAGRLVGTEQAIAGMARLATFGMRELPSLVSELHYQFHAWQDLGLSPGPVTVERVWCTRGGELAFYFVDGRPPQPFIHGGLARELAAWLVLLDKWVDTRIVIAQAQRRWSVEDLGGALAFVTPAFLPPGLLAQAPDNWERVASTLALVAGGVALATGTETDDQQS